MTQPPFIPRPDQVDYTHIRWAPVINCVVRCGGKILLVKRSDDLRLYPGYWNGVSGFLDDNKSLDEKVAEELHEEVGITRDQIASIAVGPIFHQDEPKYGKTWIVHPVLVEVKTTDIQLDWEAEKFQWVTPAELQGMKLLPGVERVLASFVLE